MSCRKEMLLIDYMDGALTGKEYDEMSLHLEGCAECRARLALMERVRESCLGLGDIAAPPTLKGSVMQAIEAAPTEKSVYRFVRPLSAVAAAAVLLFFARTTFYDAFKYFGRDEVVTTPGAFESTPVPSQKSESAALRARNDAAVATPFVSTQAPVAKEAPQGEAGGKSHTAGGAESQKDKQIPPAAPESPEVGAPAADLEDTAPSVNAFSLPQGDDEGSEPIGIFRYYDDREAAAPPETANSAKESAPAPAPRPAPGGGSFKDSEGEDAGFTKGFSTAIRIAGAEEPQKRDSIVITTLVFNIDEKGGFDDQSTDCSDEKSLRAALDKAGAKYTVETEKNDVTAGYNALVDSYYKALDSGDAKAAEGILEEIKTLEKRAQSPEIIIKTSLN